MRVILAGVMCCRVREYHLKRSLIFLSCLSLALEDCTTFPLFVIPKGYSPHQTEMIYILNTNCANAGCGMTFERLGRCICMGLRKIMRADRNVKVARQSMCRETATHVNVTAHILAVCAGGTMIPHCHSTCAGPCSFVSQCNGLCAMSSPFRGK